ncbi:MAG: hypothetical protein WC121_06005 [Candidatus Kapaibacterium sp.]|jgi:hypothetical protein
MKNSFIIIVLIFLISCGSAKQEAECVTESRIKVLISWGDYDMKNNKLINGYAVTTGKQVYQLFNLSDSIGTVPLYKTTDSVYCEMSQKLWDTILEVQKLNVPADTVRFVRYANLASGYNLNGFWNNRLKAIGSKEYREVFSILNTISPIKFEE